MIRVAAFGRKGRRILVWAAGLLAAYALLGFAVLPAVLRGVVERKLAAGLHRPVTLRRLALNPFALSATLDGLEVKEKDGSAAFLSLARAYVNLEAVSLFARGTVIREVTLTKPAVALVRREDGTYNVQDLLDEALKPKEPAGAPLRFSVNNIRVEDGSLDFDDRPNHTRHAVRGIRIGIPFLSNIASKVQVVTQPVFEASVNGAPFALHGSTKPFSETKETTLDVDLEDLDLPYYLGYAPPMPSKLTSGRLDTRLRIAFAQPAKGAPLLTVSGTAALRRLALVREGAPLAGADRLEAVVGSVDVFGRKARLEKLAFSKPEVWVRRTRSGAFELASALAAPAPAKTRPAPAKAASPSPAAAPFLVEIAELGVTDGVVHYDDSSTPFQAVYHDVAVTAKGLTTAPGKPASFSASAVSDAGETLKTSGTAAAEPFAVDGELALGRVPLRRYTPFLDAFVGFAVDDGVLDLKTKYRISGGKDGTTALSSLSAVLTSPRLRKRTEKQPFFSAPSLTLSESAIDLGKRDMALGELSSAGGMLAVVREKDGSADVVNVIAGPPPPPGTPAPPPSAPWTFALKKLALDSYTVKMDDRAAGGPAKYALTKLSFLLENMSTAPGAKASLSTRFGLDGKGVASAKGPVGFKPVFADLQADVKGIDLVPLQAYGLSSFRIALTKGLLTGGGKLRFEEGGGGNARVTFKGNARFTNVVSLDSDTKADLVKWDALSVEGLDAGANPMYVAVSKLDASGLSVDVSVDPGGALNLRRVLGSPPPPEEAEADETPAAEAPPPAAPTPAPAPAPAAPPKDVVPVRIDVLTLKKSRIGYHDAVITPGYSTTLADVEGWVKGLSSQAGTVAQMDLRGSLEKHSPISITGSVNPLAATAFLDMKGSIKDTDLPPFTPYAGKYAGYKIARGTLALEITYKLENRKLTASNHFLVDGFEFGEKVESKDATKLPVRFAVSLLKDRNGLIDLDLPIEGSLDDPKFRLGKVIWKVIGNLIGKAATAPFALLGKLFGGGSAEALSSIDFPEGRDVLDAAAKTKLDSLAKALADRPALKLDVTGRSAPEKDLEALRRLRFERKLKAQKMADLAKRGEAPASLDDVVVEEKEQAAYLKKAYKKEKFEKPKGALGFAKDIPGEEMETLMLANIAVTDGDLRQLALQRANAAKDYLTGPGKIEAGRVLVREPEGKAPDAKEKASASRVDFSLK